MSLTDWNKEPTFHMKKFSANDPGKNLRYSILSLEEYALELVATDVLWFQGTEDGFQSQKVGKPSHDESCNWKNPRPATVGNTPLVPSKVAAKTYTRMYTSAYLS